MDVTYQKPLPVRYDVDVFVAGGGPAGVAAAVTAARQGRSVFLAEGFAAFGGAAVTMLVPAFMNFRDGEHFLAGPIGQEILNAMQAQAYPRWKRYAGTNHIPVETLKLVYDDMIDASGARYLFHCNVVDAVTQNGEIQYIVCAAKGSVFAVRANVYIDCTGDGDLACYAGAGFELGDENGRTMAATLCGLWTGIDWSRVNGPETKYLDKAFADHVFSIEDRHLPGMWPLAEETVGEDGQHHADGIGGSNAGHVYDVDATQAASLTQGIIRGRHQLPEYRTYFRNYLEGYENAEMVTTAPYLGIRESRRITCDYRLVLDDFVRRASFDDEIGRYNYCVDVHASTSDAAAYQKFLADINTLRYKKGESYGIPYRSLAVSGIRNLLVAGRCVCTDRYMQSSIRVMPGCYITGQAAGMAAAVLADAHQNDVHHVDVHEVQRRLAESGTYLPNFKA